jgi:hypothetical protein
LSALPSVQIPLAGLQLATLHIPEGVHDLAVPAHAPLWQRSLSVHRLPSLQAVSSGASPTVQAPLPRSQLATLHTMLVLQTLVVPTHRPARQVSPSVQGFPSLQAVSSEAWLSRQSPVSGSQLATLQGVVVEQLLGEAPAQAPPMQVSTVVQALRSLHGVPLGLALPPSHWPEAGLHVPPL